MIFSELIYSIIVEMRILLIQVSFFLSVLYCFFFHFEFLSDTMRSTVGAGLALKLGNKARIEFNYCSPILKQNSDHVNRGFQFGIGYEFL